MGRASLDQGMTCLQVVNDLYRYYLVDCIKRNYYWVRPSIIIIATTWTTTNTTIIITTTHHHHRQLSSVGRQLTGPNRDRRALAAITPVVDARCKCLNVCACAMRARLARNDRQRP